MKHRENNIFYNVIKNETSLTEVFCNLMQYKAFRDLFLSFVHNKTGNLLFEINDIKFDNFETEKDFGFTEDDKDKKIGRGDLILDIEGIDYIFELKIETTTGTTKNQPNGYLKYLKKQDEKNKTDKNKYKKRLFFILPSGYKYINKLSEAEQNNMLYWEDFLEEIKKSELTKLNKFIDGFYTAVYERWFYFSEFNFSTIELNYLFNREKLQMKNSAIPTIMMKLLGIVDELQGNYGSNRYDESLNSEEYVFWVKNSDSKKVFWFGVDYDVWEKYGKPLVIGFEEVDKKDENYQYFEKFKDEFAGKYIEEVYEGNRYYYLPIEIDTFKSENISVIKKIIDDVKEKINMN